MRKQVDLEGPPGGPEGPGAYLGHETTVFDSGHMKKQADLEGPPGGPEGPAAYLGHETTVFDSRHMNKQADLAGPPRGPQRHVWRLPLEECAVFANIWAPMWDWATLPGEVRVRPAGLFGPRNDRFRQRPYEKNTPTWKAHLEARKALPAAYLGHETTVFDSSHMKKQADLAGPPRGPQSHV